MNKRLSLNDGNDIPVLALGVWRSHENTKQAVLEALEAGYRHIDTASVYKNEEAVGEAIKESGIPREELFITTKLWNDDVRAGNIKEAFEESLRKLQLDYVDLYLIHWPVDGYKDAYKEMIELQKQGKIKSIGVSNFRKHHLEELVSEVGVIPAIDQIEFNPGIQDEETFEYCKKNKIIVEAWSPLGRGSYLNDAVITEIAQRYNKSSAQVIIKWLSQKGIVVLPKSVHKERIIENSQVFDFELSKGDMEKIDKLNSNKRTGPDPDNFKF